MNRLSHVQKYLSDCKVEFELEERYMKNMTHQLGLFFLRIVQM